MIKKLFLIAMTISYCMIYGDFDHNQNDYNGQFTVSWQSDSSISSSSNGSNVFTQQNASSTNLIPSFIVSSNNKPSQSTPQQPQETQLVYYLVDAHGQKKIVSKEIFDKELKRVTDDYVQAAQSYFGANVDVLAPAISQAILQGTINTPEMRNQLIYQAITHLVMTGQTQLGIIRNTNLKYSWAVNKDLSHASLDDQIMINYVISRLVYCNNSKTIELAQGCLRAFDDAQQAENENEKKLYEEICRSCYSQLFNNATITPKIIAFHKNIMESDLINLLKMRENPVDAFQGRG